VALLTYQDGITEIVIVSTFHFDSRSVLFRVFTEAIYNLHALAPLGEYDVDTVGLDNYNVRFLTDGGRQFEQRILKTGTGWQVRQQALSSYFTLQELLLNNAVRSAVQELIDGFSVTDISVEFV
jgi:hypothetical protein